MWKIRCWYNKYKWTLGLHLERWNDGNEWRLYFLLWEICIFKQEEHEEY